MVWVFTPYHICSIDYNKCSIFDTFVSAHLVVNFISWYFRGQQPKTSLNFFVK